MSWQDLTNGLIELGGSVAIWLHVATLIREKKVAGVSWLAFAFFFLWGVWNLYYYPHLDQWLSFVGGLFVVSANGLWVTLAWYYIRKERQNGPKN